jgi:hypothetical protein
MSSTGSDDVVVATVSTGSGETQQSLDLTSSTSVLDTYVPTSPAGTIGDNPLVVYNWDPASQLANFLAALAAGMGASIATVGDSTTLGFGSAVSGFRVLSYPAELSQALAQDGIAA